MYPIGTIDPNQVVRILVANRSELAVAMSVGTVYCASLRPTDRRDQVHCAPTGPELNTAHFDRTGEVLALRALNRIHLRSAGAARWLKCS